MAVLPSYRLWSNSKGLVDCVVQLLFSLLLLISFALLGGRSAISLTFLKLSCCKTRRYFRALRSPYRSQNTNTYSNGTKPNSSLRSVQNGSRCDENEKLYRSAWNGVHVKACQTRTQSRKNLYFDQDQNVRSCFTHTEHELRLLLERETVFRPKHVLGSVEKISSHHKFWECKCSRGSHRWRTGQTWCDDDGQGRTVKFDAKPLEVMSRGGRRPLSEPRRRVAHRHRSRITSPQWSR